MTLSEILRSRAWEDRQHRELRDRAARRIDELEAKLAEYRNLYRLFGQDDMTDGRFVAEFERVYLADRAQ